MTRITIAKWLLTALICATLATACGGGGGGGSTAPPPPPPPSPPPPPPPPQPGVLRPIISIEQDASGAPYIRVIERVFNPFTPPDPLRTLSNLTTSPDEIDGSASTLVTNVHVTREKYGLFIVGSGAVSIYDYSYIDFDGGGSIHGAAIKIERTAGAPTYIQSAFADGLETPDPTYNVSNTDFLGVELNSGPVYVRGATAQNFGDAGVDTKSNAVYLMNVTFDNAHRMLRAWDGVEIILVNSIMNTAPGDSSHAWLYDGTSTIRYHNVIWCINADNPSPSDVNCSATPQVVEGDAISGTEAAARMFSLSSNPLPGLHPFFQTEIDRIVVEFSSNSGSTWQPLNLPNTGGGGRAPLGDTRYRIPLNFASGNYWFRARFELGGVQVGEISPAIDENGNVVN